MMVSAMDENLKLLQVFSSLSLEKIFSSQREEFYLKNVRALVEAHSRRSDRIPDFDNSKMILKRVWVFMSWEKQLKRSSFKHSLTRNARASSCPSSTPSPGFSFSLPPRSSVALVLSRLRKTCTNFALWPSLSRKPCSKLKTRNRASTARRKEDSYGRFCVGEANDMRVDAWSSSSSSESSESSSKRKTTSTFRTSDLLHYCYSHRCRRRIRSYASSCSTCAGVWSLA